MRSWVCLACLNVFIPLLLLPNTKKPLQKICYSYRRENCEEIHHLQVSNQKTDRYQQARHRFSTPYPAKLPPCSPISSPSWAFLNSLHLTPPMMSAISLPHLVCLCSCCGSSEEAYVWSDRDGLTANSGIEKDIRSYACYLDKLTTHPFKHLYPRRPLDSSRSFLCLEFPAALHATSLRTDKL